MGFLFPIIWTLSADAIEPRKPEMARGYFFAVHIAAIAKKLSPAPTRSIVLVTRAGI